MLIPNRFSNLKFSIINITALIIEFLKQEKRASIEEVLAYLRFYSDEYNRDDVCLSVTFLFALVKIEYSEKSDAIKLVKAKEAVS